MNKHIVLMKFKSSSFIKKVGVLLCFVAFALSANAQTRKVYGYRMLRQVLLLILTVTFR